MQTVDRRPKGPARPLLKLALLGRGKAVLEIDGRREELRPRLAEILVLLCAHPDGMSAEALTAGLYGDSGHVSSVRVEVSRLRKLLGPWIDAERYRLTCDVETDARRIEGLLAAGAVREAAEEYTGPAAARLGGARRGPRARPSRRLAAPGGHDRRRSRGPVGLGALRQRRG